MYSNYLFKLFSKKSKNNKNPKKNGFVKTVKPSDKLGKELIQVIIELNDKETILDFFLQ